MSAQDATDGVPTCDTCGHVVTWNERFGWLHVVEGRPYGVPVDRDPSRHEATAIEWVASHAGRL